MGWDSNSLADSYDIGLVGDYNLNLASPWVPFFQLGVLYAGTEIDDDLYNNPNESDADAWLGRLGGGVKYFMTEDIALSLAVNYDFASEELYVDDEGNLDDYNWTLLLGLRFYFD